MATPDAMDGVPFSLGGFVCPYSFSPHLLLILTCAWFSVHWLLAPMLPLLFLPAGGRAAHRQKWRRRKQLHAILTQRERQSLCTTMKADNGHRHASVTELWVAKQHLEDPEGQQVDVVKPLQRKQESYSRDPELAQPHERGQEREQFIQDARGAAPGQQSRPEAKSERREASSESCMTSNQAWTIVSRDDAKCAAAGEEERWDEESEGIRSRIALGSNKGGVELTAESRVKAGEGAFNTETFPRMRREAVATARAAVGERAVGGKGCAADEEGGLAEVAGNITATAAKEGAAAVVGQSAEEAATDAGTDAAESGSGGTESEEQELQSLETYFLRGNANVVGMLHALYLAPVALYYSIRNVVLPAAELVLAERAAAVAAAETAAAAKPMGSGTNDLSAALYNTEHLSPPRNVRELLHTYFLHWEKAPSFWDGSTDCVVIVSAYVMTSYFLWDAVECWKNARIHGRAFFFHALLSLFAGVLQVCARGIRLAGICSMFAVSEISTPFLHFRWFLIQNGYGASRLCTVTTVWTVFLFILVRAVMVPSLVFSHYWADFLFFHIHTLHEGAKISASRALVMLVLTGAWTALNLFWCLLFVRSFSKRTIRNRSAASSRKNSAAPTASAVVASRAVPPCPSTGLRQGKSTGVVL